MVIIYLLSLGNARDRARFYNILSLPLFYAEIIYLRLPIGYRSRLPIGRSDRSLMESYKMELACEEPYIIYYKCKCNA